MKNYAHFRTPSRGGGALIARNIFRAKSIGYENKKDDASKRCHTLKVKLFMSTGEIDQMMLG